MDQRKETQFVSGPSPLPLRNSNDFLALLISIAALLQTLIQFNSIQVYLYSAFYDTIVANRFTGN